MTVISCLRRLRLPPPPPPPAQQQGQRRATGRSAAEQICCQRQRTRYSAGWPCALASPTRVFRSSSRHRRASSATIMEVTICHFSLVLFLSFSLSLLSRAVPYIRPHVRLPGRTPPPPPPHRRSYTSPTAVACPNNFLSFGYRRYRGVARRCEPSSVAPASRRNSYGDIIGRVCLCGLSLVHDTATSRVECCTAPTRSICRRAKRARKERRLLTPYRCRKRFSPFYSFVDSKREKSPMDLGRMRGSLSRNAVGRRYRRVRSVVDIGSPQTPV